MVNMQLQDKTIICGECGQEFTFTAGAQSSSARSGQANPNRCAFCRAARMIAGGARQLSEGTSQPGGRSEASRRSMQSTRSLYSAVCSQCGKETKVPFEPRAYRSVYCSACYRDRRGSSDARNEGPHNRAGFSTRG